MKIAHTIFTIISSISNILINVEIDQKSYKDIFIYYIRYVTIKDFKNVKINSVNSLYLFSAKLIDTLKKLKKINI